MNFSKLAFVLSSVSLGLTTPVYAADFTVRSPIVSKGELSIEHSGAVTRDRDAAKRNEQTYTASVGYGVTEWWSVEIEGEAGREGGPDNSLRFEAVNLENTFQLTQQGSSWVDVGVFAEYGRAARRGGADAVSFGPILQKELGRTVNTLNLFVEREIGANREGGTEVRYAWQTRWPLFDTLKLGGEIFGTPGRVDKFRALADQEHRAGPVIFGEIRLGALGKIEYQAGYLIGLTRATPDGTFKWLIEYEIAF